MKRRELIGYVGASLLTAMASSLISKKSQAQTAGVTIKYLGHTSFLFTGDGVQILVNPYQSLGCTAGYSLPNITPDLVLISSQLLDEGAYDLVPGNPQVLIEPGVYDVKGIQFQGITTPHDREGGRRFGKNTVWRWSQSGVKILHLGGAAAPIELEEQILMGSPDVAFIPVGGGPKAYNPQEALQAIQTLKPKVVIPTQYLTEAADKSTCFLVAVEEFLQLAEGMSVKVLDTNTITIKPSDLPEEGTVIRVLSYVPS